MNVRRIFPRAGESIPIEAQDSRGRLAELYRLEGEHWMRVNLIARVDGSAAGTDGTSETLTNRVDRAILGVLRRSSDVVLVGAASVRAEGYQLPRSVPLAVVTSSGDLAGHRVSTADSGRVIVLCPSSAASAARASMATADVMVVPDIDGRLTPGEIVAALGARGLGRIVCEGGPELATQFLRADLVDELCLSTSPAIGGPQLPMLGGLDAGPLPLDLRQLLVDDSGTLYARWAVHER